MQPYTIYNSKTRFFSKKKICSVFHTELWANGTMKRKMILHNIVQVIITLQEVATD